MAGLGTTEVVILLVLALAAGGGAFALLIWAILRSK